MKIINTFLMFVSSCAMAQTVFVPLTALLTRVLPHNIPPRMGANLRRDRREHLKYFPVRAACLRMAQRLRIRSISGQRRPAAAH